VLKKIGGMMTAGERDILIQRLDETRLKIEGILPKIDPIKEIYPGWTIKQMLAHITGWDDVTLDSLRAHVAGRAPEASANRDLDEFNARTIASRHELDYSHILDEWRLTRKLLRTVVEEMPEERFVEPLVSPWGKKGTVTYLINIFREHEEEHVQDVYEWLKQPDKPLGKAGN
jgi:hypothetical protein